MYTLSLSHRLPFRFGGIVPELVRDSEAQVPVIVELVRRVPVAEPGLEVDRFVRRLVVPLRRRRVKTHVAAEQVLARPRIGSRVKRVRSALRVERRRLVAPVVVEVPRSLGVPWILLHLPLVRLDRRDLPLEFRQPGVEPVTRQSRALVDVRNLARRLLLVLQRFSVPVIVRGSVEDGKVDCKFYTSVLIVFQLHS